MDIVTQEPVGRLPPWRYRRAAAALLVAALLPAGGRGVYFATRQQPDQQTSVRGPFQLTDSSGRIVTDQSWRGKYLLVCFGYTYCPDVCPTTLNGLAGALQALRKTADRVQPIFITVDPRRDTPKALFDYTRLFTPRLVGLPGTADQIAQVAREYRVHYAKHQTGPGPDDNAMDHSSIIYLMAPDGHFISTISAGQQPASMAAQISQHLS